ncbi:MAG: oligosaccharide flippase family protein [Patescibacteria group bacterium]
MSRFKNLVIKVIAHEFLTASFWVFLSTASINVGNYLYHLLMGRLLGPEEYGVLEGTISFLYILSVPFSTLNLVIVKFISTYKGKRDDRRISSFYYYLRFKFLLYGSVFTLILIVISPLIISLLHLSSWYLPVLLAISFFISFFSILNKGVLQGLFKFPQIFIVSLVETISKLGIAVLLVVIGFKAVGAFASLLIAGTIGYFIALFYIRFKRFKGEAFIETKKIFKYSIPVFLTSLATTSLFTADIILVRYFFSGVDSGYYAALSVLGKVIFFAIWPITIVLFPMVSTRHSSGKNYKHLFFLSLGLSLVIASSLTIIYYTFPNFMISILFGYKYIRIAPLLGMFAIFISFYSLSSLLSNFYLSLNKSLTGIICSFFAVLQIILIIMNHKDLLQIVEMSTIATSLLFVSLVMYYPFKSKN